MSKLKSSESRKNQLPLIITLLLIVIFIFIGGLIVLYLNPEILMTNTANKLTGKDFVETENAIRGNVLSIGGAIFIVGTLLVNIVQTRISAETLNLTLEKLESEKEKEWRNKVEDAYVEWAEAFLSATRNGIYIARYTFNKDKQKEEEARRKHSTDDLIRQKATRRILMFERRKQVLEKFNEINNYPYPHYPIIKHIEDKKQREDADTCFWHRANDNEQIKGYFYGITEQRLTKFFYWISNPDKPLEIPSFNDYLEFVKDKIPELTNVIKAYYKQYNVSI